MSCTLAPIQHHLQPCFSSLALFDIPERVCFPWKPGASSYPPPCVIYSSTSPPPSAIRPQTSPPSDTTTTYYHRQPHLPTAPSQRHPGKAPIPPPLFIGSDRRSILLHLFHPSSIYPSVPMAPMSVHIPRVIPSRSWLWMGWDGQYLLCKIELIRV